MSHVVYKYDYHIVWTPKYRYRVLFGEVKSLAEDDIGMLCHVKHQDGEDKRKKIRAEILIYSHRHLRTKEGYADAFQTHLLRRWVLRVVPKTTGQLRRKIMANYIPSVGFKI